MKIPSRGTIVLVAMALAVSVSAPPPASSGEATAASALPPVVHVCDIESPAAAELGREGLIGALGLPGGAIVVGTGGVLMGSGAPAAERAACGAALLDAAGVDVANLALRDVTGDPAAIAKAVRESRTRFVSASLRLSAGETPWKGFAVIDRGGVKVAFVGIAARTASMLLPGSAAAAGIEYMESAAALAKAIPAAAAEADSIVILADADPVEAAPWLMLSPKVKAVIVSGRGSGAQEIASRRGLVLSPPGGAAVGILLAGPEGLRSEVRKLDRPARPSAAFDEVARRFAFVPSTPAGAPAPEARWVPLASLEPNRLVPLGAGGRNRAVALRIPSMGWLDAVGTKKAPAGRRFLAIDTDWRNLLTPEIVRDQAVPVAYRIPRLQDHFYLVADGRRVIRPINPEGLAGALSLQGLELPLPGSKAEGRLLYEVAADQLPGSLEIRFYDFAHGSMVLPLISPKVEAPEGKPLAGPSRNEILEVAVQTMTKTGELGGRKAPAGQTFLVIDLRARSLFTLESDASAYDPKARKGAKIRIGTVADWKESRKYLQAIVDGVHTYSPEPETELDEEPRFLPDLMTGGRAAFLVPEAARSIEIRCDFPNADLSGKGLIRPTGIVFPLEGTRPAPAARKAMVSVDDGPFRMSVVDQAAVDAFAGQKADGGRLLVLDMVVKNVGKAGEFFQTAEQLRHAAEDGAESELDEVTFLGPYRPGKLVWIPAGEERAFQAVWRISADERRPRLSYRGVSLAKILDLGPIAGAQAADAPQTAAAAKAEVAMKKAGPKKMEEKAPAPEAKAVPKAPPAKVAQAPAKAEEKKQRPDRIPARSDRTARGIEGVGLTAEAVNRAIDRGCEWLWKEALAPDIAKGRKFGTNDRHVIMSLALVHSGGHRKFPDFNAALRGYLASVMPRNIGVYENGVLAMLIESYGDPTYLPKMRGAARYLTEAQGKQGTWNYGLTLPLELFTEPSRPLRVSGGAPLDGEGGPAATMERATPWEKGVDGDNSVSQFALLGLHAADRSGIGISAEAWRRCLDGYRKRQNETDGGWSYTNPSSSYGSMTCAGICSLAISRFHLGEKDPAADPGIERGLAWLDWRFKVTENPGSSQYQYYYLYSLERVGRILDTEFIGDHEWYPEGARLLVDAQQADGSWVSGTEKEPPLDTSFALLFLTRATPRLAVEHKRGGDGTLKAEALVPPGGKYYIILDASGSMIAEMEGRPKFAAAVDAVAALVSEIPPGSQVALRVYGHRKSAIEAGAEEDTALEIPMGTFDRAKFLARLKSLRAKGKTPLARSLQEASRDLRGASEGKPVAVVLLTDGGDDTGPKSDPGLAAESLGKLPGIFLHIVGFDIGREDWSAQLRAMARRAGGNYWPVAKASNLIRDLRSAVLGVPEAFSVLDRSGKEAGRGKFGESMRLPEGKYGFRTEYLGKVFADEFWINTEEITVVTFDGAAAAAAEVPLAGEKPAAQAPEKSTGKVPEKVPQKPAMKAPKEEKPPPAPPAGEKGPAAKFCSQCGKALNPGGRFCGSCGKKTD